MLYEGAINCLYRFGLVAGVNGTEFQPNVLLRREQAASMLVNFVEKTRKATLAAGDSASPTSPAACTSRTSTRASRRTSSAATRTGPSVRRPT
jgi:hypothetical protein